MRLFLVLVLMSLVPLTPADNEEYRAAVTTLFAGEEEAGIAQLRELVLEGNRAALLHLEYLHDYEVIKPSETEPRAWLRRQAEKGDPFAQKRLATELMEDRDTYAEGFSWLERAAEVDLESQLFVAHAYANGKRVPKDPERAGEFYRKAIDAGSLDARYELALLIEAGSVASQDPLEAYRHYWMLANRGHRGANRRVYHLSKLLTEEQRDEVRNQSMQTGAEGEHPVQVEYGRFLAGYGGVSFPRYNMVSELGQAKRERLGTLSLDVFVSDTGKIERAVLIHSSDEDYAAFFVKWLQTHNSMPAQISGRPVASLHRVRFGWDDRSKRTPPKTSVERLPSQPSDPTKNRFDDVILYRRPGEPWTTNFDRLRRR